MMNWTGLVSITHRELTADEVIHLAARAGLNGIEWGGDVHVPHGRIDEAERVGRLTRRAGLQVAAYGSYYRAGTSESQGLSFQAVLDTAAALQTRTIRVWAGTENFECAGPGVLERVTEDLRRICEMAAVENRTVAMEFHDGTANNCPEGSLHLIQQVQATNLKTFWQPRTGETVCECIDTIRQLNEHLANVHVFNWLTGRVDQTLLHEAQNRWELFLKELVPLPGDRFFCIEFVKDQLTENTLADAAVLRQWIDNAVSTAGIYDPEKTAVKRCSKDSPLLTSAS